MSTFDPDLTIVCWSCGETVGRCAQKLGRGEGRCCSDCTHGSR